MNRFFCTVGFVVCLFCFIFTFTRMIDLAQNEIIKEIVIKILAPLKNPYVSIPLVICWLGFTICLIHRMFFGRNERNRKFLVTFSLGGFLIYISSVVFLTISNLMSVY